MLSNEYQGMLKEKQGKNKNNSPERYIIKEKEKK